MSAYLSVGLLANAQTVDLLKPAKDIALRAPSVPIIVSDPYFSIWSPYDKLMEGSTEHWTSAKKQGKSVFKKGQNLFFFGFQTFF